MSKKNLDVAADALSPGDEKNLYVIIVYRLPLSQVIRFYDYGENIINI